jgi:hypothetical protein
MPGVIDGADERTGKAYDAWPTRVVVVAPDGKVAFSAGIDSEYYLHMEKFQAWLDEYLRGHAG